MSRWQKFACKNIELNVEIAIFTNRRIVFVPHAVVQRDLRAELPLVLCVPDVILLFSKTLAGGAVVEHAGIRKITDIAVAGKPVYQKIRQAVVRVLRSAVSIGVETYQADFAAEFRSVIPSDVGQAVDVRKVNRVYTARRGRSPGYSGEPDRLPPRYPCSHPAREFRYSMRHPLR